MARLLRVSRNTVAQKRLFLSVQARLQHQTFLKSYLPSQIQAVQFDEMESFERSKCLPVSIPMVVEEGTRKILSFKVCSMPAKGPLAKISLIKYGKRKDERAQAAAFVFSEVQHLIDPKATIGTDQNPKYPAWIKPHFPEVTHQAFKGRRGCVVGQGELKRGGFDPLFSFNHTAAMLRANINRLFRRTWCTTKLKERLEDHIAIYARYHNTVLT